MNEHERAVAARLLAYVDDGDREILTLRYSLDGHAEPRSLGEVAEILGCSEEVVRQREIAAMGKIRVQLSGNR